MSFALQLGALALAAAVLSVLLRGHRPEFVLPLQLAAGALLLLTALPAVREEGEKLVSAFETMAVPSQVTAALLKGAAVCLVTRLCAAFCKDSGNEALSAALLFAGRVGTLLPALPLLEETLEIIRGFAG